VRYFAASAVLLGGIIVSLACAGGIGAILFTVGFVRLAVIGAAFMALVGIAVFSLAAYGQIRRPTPGDWRCPACAYDLADLPPQTDGEVRCPECGQWTRLPDTPPRATSRQAGPPDGTSATADRPDLRPDPTSDGHFSDTPTHR
jgi:hypothetical protein